MTMTQAFQVALGSNIPLRISTAPAILDVEDPALFTLKGGNSGDVWTSAGAGGAAAWQPATGASGGATNVDGVSIVGAGTLASPIAVATIDCGTY